MNQAFDILIHTKGRFKKNLNMTVLGKRSLIIFIEFKKKKEDYPYKKHRPAYFV